MGMPPEVDAPAALNLVRWMRSPFKMLERYETAYGDAFTVRLPVVPRPITMLSEPEAVKDVFALGPNEAHAGEANLILKPFVGQHSLLLLDGSEHLRQRKMMLPAFHGERMQSYGRAMLDLAHDSIDRWPVGRPFAVHRPMQSITLQVILRTVFGIEGASFAELAEVLTKALDAVASPVLLIPAMQKDLGRFSPWGRYRRYVDRGDAILRGEIRRVRSAGTKGRSDVLAMILDARDERGEPLTEDEIHDELVTLLVAGHETTATALVWALRWVLPNGSLVARLREEIAGAGDDPVKIGKLELLDATVKEALRLQPVIPMVARVLLEPHTFGRWDVPRGHVVAPAIYLVNRRPEIYRDPGRFNPDRFLSFKPAAYEWIPFGGGLRRCIGAAFAMHEMKMVLAALLPRVDARLVDDDVRMVRRAITITPKNGLPIAVVRKRDRLAPRRAA